MQLPLARADLDSHVIACLSACPLPARLCAGDGNGDMKHVCAASRSRAEFPTVIILLPSLPPCRLPEGRADYSSAIVQVTYKWICMEAGWEGQRVGFISSS